ncbi:hypothetical protein JIG36_30630 [Actinoplanes sp. LDG1-06]|uniref:Uncharacterized protein n=1 Tax=Paractinoplanes ovalisporus TaxID=2810368 RepID=A0ABS2AJ73_9ACTN|nr:hypothetical protein [Actinoplanes ovalisporus]MBM2619876.1 hypothetical protein [Actinoplanes ovalisporus]
MQINSLSSLVTSAYDTARSNLKSMAEAAAESGKSEPVTPALAKTPEPTAPEAPKPVPGQRQGVNLDSYA